MINRVVLVGRLTKDPEARTTGNQITVTSFTVAVSRPFVNQQTGTRDADFIPVVVWRKQAENASKYLKKGSLCGVEGRIQTRTYDDQNGVRKYVTEVIADNVYFLESKGGDNSLQDDSQGNQGNSYKAKDDDDSKYDDVKFADNDLPF